MGRGPKWYERLPRWQRKVLDQVFHALAGCGISGLVGGVLTVWLDGGLAGSIGALVGAAAGGIRELVQNIGDTNNDDAGNWLDFGVWASAAIVVGIIVGAS